MEKKKVSRRDFIKATGVLGLGAAASSVIQACAKATPIETPAVVTTRKDLVLGIVADAKSLGFTVKPGHAGMKVRNQISPKMIVTDYATNKLMPELLVEWSAENPTTWVGKLREGVKWQRGYGEVTAEDIAYTINYIKENNAYKSSSAHQFTQGAKARSKYVVEFNLMQPFGPFPGIGLDDGGIVACKAAHEEMGEDEYSRNPVGFGPYMLKEWVSGSHFILEKNPDYWREGLPILEELTFRIISDPSTTLASLETGEIDWSENIMSQDFAAIEASPQLKLVSVPGWNWHGLCLPFAPHFAPEYVPPDLPTQILEVRQAISYAINRKAIVDVVYNGYGQPGDNPLMEGYLGFEEYCLMYPETGDLEKAQELMDSAGVDGFDLEVMVKEEGQDLVRAMEMIAERVAKIGVNIIIDPVDSATWTDQWRNNMYQSGYTKTGFIAADSDAPIFAFNRSEAVHWKGWPNGEVDDWLDRERAISDPDERAELFQKVVQKSLVDCPYVYTCHTNLSEASHKDLMGVPTRRVEHEIKLAEAYWAA